MIYNKMKSLEEQQPTGGSDVVLSVKTAASTKGA